MNLHLLDWALVGLGIVLLLIAAYGLRSPRR